MTATATDDVTDAPLTPLPPEAGDVNAVHFDPNEEWLRRATPPEQKAAMWRWFATRYESAADPESAAPQDTSGSRVHDASESDVHVDEVLHERFDGVVPTAVVDELAHRVQQRAGPVWARRGIDKFSG